MLTRREAWAVALIATLTMTVSYIDRATLAVLAPSVTEALDISETEYGWLQSAFSIAYLVATPLAGWWIDRVGARRGLTWSVLLWTSVAALHALAPGFAILFLLRIGLGFAEGPSFPGSAQTVQNVLPPADRARGFGVLFTGSSIGGMLVPPLASFLYDLAGWRVAFVGTALAGLVWIPLWLWVTRTPLVREKLDTARAPSSVAGPTFWMLLREPVIQRGLLGILAAAPLLGFLQAWGAKYLKREYAIAQEDVGSYLWLPPLLLDVGAILFGDLASRQRRAPGAPPRLLHAIAMVIASSIVFLPFATTPWEAMTIAGIAIGGGGALYTLVTADTLGRVPMGSVSLAGGILAGAQSLSLVIINPVIGKMVEHDQSFDRAAISLGVWVIPPSLAWLLWRPRAIAA